VAHRIHKVLEGANVKLSSVLTDVYGHFGRSMVEALIRLTPEIEEQLRPSQALIDRLDKIPGVGRAQHRHCWPRSAPTSAGFDGITPRILGTHVSQQR
jgi:hypothetical protein